MSDTYYGKPATVDQAPMPKATVNIASSTNASPTVITTATAHGLHTGDALIIANHATNTNANGLRVATVLTSTTFKISTLAGYPGTFINGNGVGAGTGTVQPLSFPGLTIAEDLVDDINAATWNVPDEALADMVSWLALRNLAYTEILRGGYWKLLAGATGQVNAGATMTVYGTLALDTDGIFKPSFQLLDGTISLRTPQRFGDADNTINVGSGHEIILETAPTTARTLTLTAPTRDGLFLDISMHHSASSLPGSKYYEIKRNGSANYIVRLSGWSTDLATNLGSGRVRIVADGGVWRLAGGVGILNGTDA